MRRGIVMLAPRETMTQDCARKFRVLVPELDYGELLQRVGHRVYPREGAEFVAVALRDAGFEAELTRLVEFMSAMGSRLKKEVLLTDENCPDQVLCSYDPEVDRIQFNP